MNVKGYFQKYASTAFMILILISFRWSFADQYRVPTGSMLPTIQIGDHLLTNKLAYDFRVPFTEHKLFHTGNPQRGDIAVFIFPVDEKTNLVKRIIGLPGEHLVISGPQVFIDGKKLNEPYLTTEMNGLPADIDVVIPADHYFVMGDNRNNSYDSRYWGLVPRKNIKGKALGVLWNINFPYLIPVLDVARTGHSLTSN